MYPHPRFKVIYVRRDPRCGLVCVCKRPDIHLLESKETCVCVQKRPMYPTILHMKKNSMYPHPSVQVIYFKRDLWCVIVYICANAPTPTFKRPKRGAYVSKQTDVSNYFTHVKETYVSSSTCKSHICQNRRMMCRCLNLCKLPDNHVQESKESGVGDKIDQFIQL